jgi:hypothetical protein
MQKLAAFVCNAEPPKTHLNASETWSRAMGSAATKSDSSIEVLITKPDGKVVKSQGNSEGQFSFSETRLLGTYTGKMVGAKETMLACVTSQEYRSAKESTLAYLTADELTKLAGSCKASVATSASDLLANTVSEWNGREVWTWIWTALLFCFLAEIALEQRLSPRVKSKVAASSSLRGTTA